MGKILNSYEIAEKLNKKLHIKAAYELKSVNYNPCYSMHRIYIEDIKNKDYVFDIDDTTLQRNIEAIGINAAFKMIEDEINEELRDIELDSLIDYYYSKGMHMAEINKKFMTGGLSK